MLRIEKRFRLAIAIFFILNVVTTATAMIMIEKMIADRNSERSLLENQMNALAALGMEFEALGEATTRNEELKQASFVILDNKGWSTVQESDLTLIRTAFLPGTITSREDLKFAFKRLLNLQNQRLTKSNQSLKAMGLAGSWTVGILSIFSLTYLFLASRKIRREIVDPLAEIVHGMGDWLNGNRQRRLNPNMADSAVHESINQINEVLDKDGQRF